MQVAGPVGIRVRQRRKELGVTQVALAQRIGISPSYLNLIEADKRAVGGRLLKKLADALELHLDVLTGTTERRLIERLGELAADPSLAGLRIDPDSANLLVSRHPDWAAALLALARLRRDAEQHAAAMSDRLAQDPALAGAVHRVLNHAAAVRSTSEILTNVDDLTAAQRQRFVDIILSQSGELSTLAQELVERFGSADAGPRSLSPAEEVDDFIIQNRSHYPALEDLAADLRRRVRPEGALEDGALAGHLERRFGVGIRHQSALEADLGRFRNLCHYDAGARTLTFLDNAPASTRRFQLARLLVRLSEAAAVAAVARDELLSSDEARTRAFEALTSYTAAAMLAPYDAFLEDAERFRYDVELLRQRYGASVEQVFQRLVSLRRPDAEGIPFAFFRADPSGHISKRFPVAGLPIPRSGNGCSLWPLYSVFQTPGRVIRQLAEFPNGSRYLFVARTIRHEPGLFHEQPFLRSVMLACDVVYADRTVYGDGLDLAKRQMATAVGPACRLCPRRACIHRGEESVLRERED
ncbi:helix-turn-helix domain-containing protein [Minwuia thermotolerans]|uniref:XRE family transcriptional regulator n=1 Tax=Minwuia thermotolerans TaxID=2056226 RepID=A0A2M9FYK2_9PROT|nr:XRE family transcriptional regulator [Minwuia thermotolerans]PJK28541.1 XRE family transcriptional regulator [Minwuia thermotolerans]